MKLVKSRNDAFVWLYGPGDTNQKFCGGIFETLKFGETELNIPFKEMVWGLADAVGSGNDVIEFGEINGMFLFSRKGKTV